MVNEYSGLKEGYNLGCLSSPYGLKDIMEKEIFEDTIIIPFEHFNFSCLREYDRYLTNIYGNYMEFPPVAQQVTHHDFVAYWK